MNKLNSIRRAMSTTFARGLVACSAVVVLASSALAQGEVTEVETLITGAQSTITGIIAKVLTAGAAILVAAIALKAMPYAYRKITGFFK